MKKLFFLMIGMIITSVYSFAQHDIKYDFQTKQFTILDTNLCKDTMNVNVGRLVLKYNKPYRFILTNVDRRVYSDFSISSEQRDFFEGELAGSYPKLQTGDAQLTKLTIESGQKFAASDTILAPPQEYLESYEKLLEKANSVIEIYNSIDTVKQYYNDLSSLFNLYKNRDISYQTMLPRLYDIESKYRFSDSIIGTLDQKMETAFSDFAMEDAMFTKNQNNRKVEEDIDSCKILHQQLSSDINNYNDKFTKFNKNNGYKRLLLNIESILYRMKNLDITDIFFPELIQPKKDELIVKLEFNERVASPDEVKVVPRKCSYTFEVGGGVKITASTGLMLGMNLFDRHYSVYPATEGDTVYSIITEDTNHSIFQPTVAAMMHILWRTSGCVTGGLTWGLGTNLSTDMNMMIFLGGSVVFGREERFIISGGFATAPVDFLNGKYSENTPIRNSEIDLTKLTEKAFRPGWFIGISYNLSKQKKEQPGNPDSN